MNDLKSNAPKKLEVEAWGSLMGSVRGLMS